MAMILNTYVLVVITLYMMYAVNASVPEVQTVSTVSLESGKTANLTCGYNRSVYVVYWRYESATSPTELLVVRDEYYQVGERSGPGYDEGRFDIAADYSLIIEKVKVRDEGRYTCEVSDFTFGQVFRNHTDVVVNAMAEHPTIRIGQCEDDLSQCVIHTKPDQQNLELTCSVVGVKPKVALSWISSDHWNSSNSIMPNTNEGTFDQTLTVHINTSQLSNQTFTCIAKGLAVYGMSNRTIGVYVIPIEPPIEPHASGFAQDVNITTIAVLCVVATLVVIFSLGIVLYKRACCSNQARADSEVPLLTTNDGKRSAITDIMNKNAVGLTPLYFGVFGSKEAGRTLFIESLCSAFQGEHVVNKEETSEETVWQSTRWFADERIAICEIKDNQTIDPACLKKLLKPICKDETRKFDEIHYPIFIYDVRKHIKKDDEYEKSLSKFAGAVYRNIFMYPILVLTHVPQPLAEKRKIIRRLNLKTNIPTDDIFVYENLTIERDEDFKKEDAIGNLLDILLKCINNVTREIAVQQAIQRKSIAEDAKESWIKGKRKAQIVHSFSPEHGPKEGKSQELTSKKELT